MSMGGTSDQPVGPPADSAPGGNQAAPNQQATAGSPPSSDPSGVQGAGPGEPQASSDPRSEPKPPSGPGGTVAQGTGNNQSAKNGGGPADALAVAVPAAFDLGWSMAQIANLAVSDVRIGGLQRVLPSEHELPRTERARLDAVRTQCLIQSLAVVITPTVEPAPTDEIRALSRDLESDAPDWVKVKADLIDLHLRVLDWLACAGRPIVLAYQLGRSLHDTVTNPAQTRAEESGGEHWEPNQPLHRTVAVLLDELNRPRISVMQEWLATLGPHFPDSSATVVKTSLGRWSDWVNTTLNDETAGGLKNSGDKNKIANEATRTVLGQGDVWLNLLTGAQSLAGILSPEAYVAAGEAALTRSTKIVQRIVRHYWVALAVVALSAAALTALSAEVLGGASKVWTIIATIAGALGVTAKGIGTRVARLTDAGERPIYRIEELDALAWAVTNLPQVKLDRAGVRALRRSGISPTASLGR